MKLSHAFVLCLVSLSLARSAAASNCINKDLINLGPTAYDVGVLITGNQPITWHYDGYPANLFNTFTAVNAGPNKFLHWRNVNGVNAPIPTGGLVHIGWCTASPNNIVDMWFTDLSGGRVPGSVVYQIAAHSWNGSLTTGVAWDNTFRAANALVVSNARAAVSNSPWELGDLNRENTVLAQQLKPLEGGTSLSIKPGATASLPVPNAKSGQWIVVVYEATGNGSTARSEDYVQFQVP